MMMGGGKNIPLSFSSNVNDGSATFLADSRASICASSSHYKYKYLIFHHD